MGVCRQGFGVAVVGIGIEVGVQMVAGCKWGIAVVGNAGVGMAGVAVVVVVGCLSLASL